MKIYPMVKFIDDRPVQIEVYTSEATFKKELRLKLKYLPRDSTTVYEPAHPINLTRDLKGVIQALQEGFHLAQIDRYHLLALNAHKVELEEKAWSEGEGNDNGNE